MSTTNKQLNLPAFNDPNWDVPLNANFNYVDSSFGDTLNISQTSANVYAVTSTQLRNMRIFLSDTLTGTGTLTVPPAYGGFWIITNSTTGGFDINVKVTTGSNLALVKNGYSIVVYSDGVNCYDATSQKFNTTGGTITGNLSLTGTLNIGSGKLTYNPSAGTPQLYVTGTIFATGNITAFSDERLKKNISTIDGSLGIVGNMRGVRFEDKDGNKYVGLIAQEVQSVVPEAVAAHESGYLSVAYQNLVGVLVNAINELAERVKKLEEN